jgi:cell division initiation protein
LLTPRDILHMEFRRVWRGYNPSQVDAFLHRIVIEYEALAKENASLKREIEEEDKAPKVDEQKVANLNQAITAQQERVRALQQEETNIRQRIAYFVEQYLELLQVGHTEAKQLTELIRGWQTAAATTDESGLPE